MTVMRRSGWLWSWLLTLGLALGSLACSDDASGGGDTDPNADSDVAFDSPGDAQPDRAEDGAGDLVEDTVPDVVPDTISDGDGGASDLADVVPDVDDDVPDLNTGDQGDGGTVEFPICPYETESATVDCDTVCAAVVVCDGEAVEAFCTAFCTTARRLFNQGAATAFADCTTSTTCESVPEGEQLGGFCFETSSSGLPANEAASAACATVDAAIETCAGEASTFGDECNLVAPVLRTETAPILEQCAEAECDDIQNCVSAAVCDILL